MTNDPRATDPDDFWGNQADWPEVPEEERKAPRTSTGSKVSRWWNQVIGGGVEGTRQHSGRGAASRDHGDFAQDEFDPAPDDPIAAPVRHAAAEPSIPTEAVDESWDDEWIVEPDPTPSPGVDPLLARLGGLAIVTTLLIPLALGLRSHDDSPAAADVTSAVVTLAGPVDTSVPPTPAVTAAPTVVADTAASTSAASSAEVTAAPEPATTAAPAASTPPISAADQSTSAADQSSAELSTAAVASETAAPEQSCAIDYDVVEGDFWIRLADASGVPLDELLDANDATVETPLYPGATMCLPDGATVPAPPTTAAPVTTTPTTTPATTAKPVTTSKPVSTTAPTTTAKPVVTYPTISAAAAAQIIRVVWPDELEGRAIEIATRESSLVVTAKNSCCYGLFQMNWDSHKAWLAGLGVNSPEQLFDATTNANAAYALYVRSGGWGPWT